MLTVNESNFTGNTAATGGAIYNNGDLIAHFNRFVGNSDLNGYTILSGSGDATLNWWGDNNNPAGKVNGASTDSWLTLTVTASPNIIIQDSNSAVTANLLYDSGILSDPTHPELYYHNPALGHVPDGIPVTFAASPGSYIIPIPTELVNGQANATFSSQSLIGGTTVYLSAEVDSETQYYTINIGIVINTRTLEVFNTIQSAINDADTLDGDTLQISPETLIGDGSIIDVTKSITITGTGFHETIIDANNLNYIFLIRPSFTVTLNNLTLINGEAGEGGAIHNEGTLTITDCTFIGNTAIQDGGAIHNDGTLTVTGSNFTSNTAYRDGGAIQNDGTLTVTGSNFTSNTAYRDGGAIFNLAFCTLTVTGSTFIDNTTNSRGGAICDSFEGVLTVNYNIFVGNSDLNGRTIFGSGDATLNWWGDNNNPSSKVTVGVNYSPWIYMTFIVNPNLIHTSETSQLNVSFNNAYDGTALTPIDPVSGHLIDGCTVTFTTDMGSVNNATTSNGEAPTTFTADLIRGTAHLTAQLDNQILYNDIIIISSTVYYVNGTTGDDTYDGSSPTHTTGLIGPKQHIQAAINAAIGGGIVSVAAGTYNENIVLDKNLDLEGQGTPTIIASDINQPAVTINRVGAIIKGFTITGANSSAGISLVSAHNCYLMENTISNNFMGVYIQNSNINTVSSNNILNNGWVGVCIDNSGSNTVNGGNDITGNVEGIYIVNTSNGNNIQGNNIHDNTDTGIAILNSPEGNTISGNIAISHNGVIGVLIQDANSNTISGNNIQSNGWAGLALYQAYYNTINGNNNISDNLEGLNITRSYEVTISGNNIHDNTNIGISIINSTTEITGNAAISSNGIIGVYLRDSSTNTISGNTIQINSWVGVCFDQATGNTINGSNNISGNLEGLYIVNNSNSNNITSNNIHENQDTGIYIDGSTGNNITGNTVIGFNGVIGILLRGADTNTISENTIIDNGWTGIALDNADSNTINGFNIITGNQEGMYITNSSGNTINENSISNNTNSGVDILSNSNNNTLTNNQITNNSVMGVFIQNSNSNTVHNNTLQTNGWAGIILDTSTINQIYYNNFNNNPLQALAQNGTGNTIYHNYWSDWGNTDPRPIDGNEGLYDEDPSTTPF